MRLVLSVVFFTLLLPTLVGGAAVTIAAAPSAAPLFRPLFPWVPPGGYPHPFPFGQCTWWAAYNYPVTWNGDARDWLTNAAAAGAATSAVPSIGAIAVYRPGGQYSVLGHVAIVTDTDAASYTVSEMNAPRWGIVSTRVITWPDPAVRGFIPVAQR